MNPLMGSYYLFVLFLFMRKSLIGSGIERIEGALDNFVDQKEETHILLLLPSTNASNHTLKLSRDLGIRNN